jgi:hypothetical protein
MRAAQGFRKGEISPRSLRRKRMDPSSLFIEEKFERGFSVPSSCELGDFCIHDINNTEIEGDSDKSWITTLSGRYPVF